MEIVKSLWFSVRSLIRTFRRQRIPGALLIALTLLALALIFSFLAFVPVLSPFIYPLF